jgi:transcriptional regulator with XRE-family HTH domain
MGAEVVSLAERLKSRRDELGISQSQAARELDVARTAYRLWEMEAAKPSPDRWRLIAGWLGVSVTTLLLAEELITEDEAAVTDSVSSDFEGVAASWDAAAAAKPGTFFAQARTLLEEGLGGGTIAPASAAGLRAVFDRIEERSGVDASPSWQPTEIRRALPRSAEAIAGALSAIDFAGSGMPRELFETARLLTSELVATGIGDGAAPDSALVLFVSVGRERLRVELSDGTSPDIAPMLKVAAELASRWGAGREGDLHVTWFELDLPTPGTG